MDDEKIKLEWGELSHKIERFEIDFLKGLGINPDYNAVENLIEKIINLFEKQFSERLEIDPDEFEVILMESENRERDIAQACLSLPGLKSAILKLEDSETKNLISMFCENIERNLKD